MELEGKQRTIPGEVIKLEGAQNPVHATGGAQRNRRARTSDHVAYLNPYAN